jgi:hypothetical protein
VILDDVMNSCCSKNMITLQYGDVGEAMPPYGVYRSHPKIAVVLVSFVLNLKFLL